jgi:hypothetical protein
MRCWIYISFAIVLAVAAFFGAWIVAYPSESDHKNIRYVCWKAGVCKMNLDMATGTMIGDPTADKLVIGKTEAELRFRFGFLVELSQAGGYYQSCYESSSWKNRRVLFLRNSPWMVVFSGDRASNLVLIKGC